MQFFNRYCQSMEETWKMKVIEINLEINLTIYYEENNSKIVNKAYFSGIYQKCLKVVVKKMCLLFYFMFKISAE